MNDIAGLIERLEMAKGPDDAIDRAIRDAFDLPAMLVPPDGGDEAHPYTGSLDAARTLVPDGLAWTLGQNVHHHYWQASVNNLDDEGRPQSIGYSGLRGDPTPELALCIAALKARQSLAQ